ncbi:MAG TPA: hypothetical protein VL096_19770, partial [Pirellulaceae bacterium]|nr:hypothetical protein [Pirellulaceae bacterium]
MPLTIACPGCGQRFAVSEKMRGKKAKCSKCGAVLSIPAPEPVAAEIVADELELAPTSSAADPLGLGSLPDPLARSATATYHATAAPNHARLILLAVGGGGVLVVLILMAIAVSQIRSVIANRPPGSPASSGSAPATVGLDPSGIAVPSFPELGAAQTLPGGVKVYFVDTRTSPTNRGSEPGQSMRMRIYVPS